MKYLKLFLIGMVSLGAIPVNITWSFGAEALENKTVSFGQWLPAPPPGLDRLKENPAGGTGNVHQLDPQVVTIRAGGAINFIISGLHNVQVYDDGTQPEDFKLFNPLPTLPGNGGGIINVPEKRIYRGWDPNPVPNTFERDRVEVVHFDEPGIYLVICGVHNHFVDDKMFGFVRVLPGRVKLDR